MIKFNLVERMLFEKLKIEVICLETFGFTAEIKLQLYDPMMCSCHESNVMVFTFGFERLNKHNI